MPVSRPESAPAFSAGPHFDEMDTPGAWTGPIYQYGIKATGKAWFDNGILTIRREPGAKWHAVSMKRSWTIDPRHGFWVHFRFRIEEMLLGVDLYATAYLGKQSVIQMGVNGEQHWIQGAACQSKKFDDELFWGSDLIVGEEGGKRGDIRVGLPDSVRLRYTDWTLVSMHYDVADTVRRLRLFVNGHEIIYRDLDAAAPAGRVNNTVRPDVPRFGGSTPLTLELVNFGDGDLYADTSVHEGAGVRWLHAFASDTPAHPHVSDPRKAQPRHSDMQYDFVLIHTSGEVGVLPKKVLSLVADTPLAKLLSSHSTSK